MLQFPLGYDAKRLLSTAPAAAKNAKAATPAE
jgi:hypothetical protein